MSGHWGWNAWLGQDEPDLRALYEWIDTESRSIPDKQGGWIGAIVGTSFGLGGGSLGIIGGVFKVPPTLFWFWSPLLLASIISAVGTWLILRNTTLSQKSRAQAYRQSMSFVYRLIGSRWRGGIKSYVGEEAATVLNEGAQACLRARSVLKSPAWKASSAGSVRAIARDNALAAVDTAMARLVISVCSGTYSPGDTEISKLIVEMRAIADEAAHSADIQPTSTLGNEAVQDLRVALQDLRRIADAERELNEDRLRPKT